MLYKTHAIIIFFAFVDVHKFELLLNFYIMNNTTDWMSDTERRLQDRDMEARMDMEASGQVQSKEIQ